jgi:thymidine kinase
MLNIKWIGKKQQYRVICNSIVKWFTQDQFEEMHDLVTLKNKMEETKQC